MSSVMSRYVEAWSGAARRFRWLELSSVEVSFGLFRLAKVWRLSYVAFRLGLVRFGWASSGGHGWES